MAKTDGTELSFTPSENIETFSISWHYGELCIHSQSGNRTAVAYVKKCQDARRQQRRVSCAEHTFPHRNRRSSHGDTDDSNRGGSVHVVPPVYQADTTSTSAYARGRPDPTRRPRGGHGRSEHRHSGGADTPQDTKEGALPGTADRRHHGTTRAVGNSSN